MKRGESTQSEGGGLSGGGWMVVVKGGDDFSTLYKVCYLLGKIKGQNDSDLTNQHHSSALVIASIQPQTSLTFSKTWILIKPRQMSAILTL